MQRQHLKCLTNWHCCLQKANTTQPTNLGKTWVFHGSSTMNINQMHTTFSDFEKLRMKKTSSINYSPLLNITGQIVSALAPSLTSSAIYIVSLPVLLITTPWLNLKSNCLFLGSCKARRLWVCATGKLLPLSHEDDEVLLVYIALWRWPI